MVMAKLVCDSFSTRLVFEAYARIIGAGSKPMDERPLFSVGDIEEEFENGNPVVAGTREEGSREVGGTGERREWR